MIYKENRINNIPLYINKTQMVKNIFFKMFFVMEANSDDFTAFACLVNLLTMTTKKYNTKRKLANVLSDNYFISINTNFFVAYKTAVFSVTLDVVNGKYIKDDKILDNAINIFKEVVFNPNVNDCSFCKENYEEVVNDLRNSYLKRKNNKDVYACNKLINLIYKDSILSKSSSGNLEDLEKLNNQDVYNCYLHLLNNSEKSFYITGDVDLDIVDKLSFLNNYYSQEQKINSYFNDFVDREDEIVVMEKMAVNQGKLCIGLRYNFEYNLHNCTVFSILSTMLGEMQSSTLFQVIREENSLAYSIECALVPNAKSLIILAGIDKDDYHKCVELIRNVLSDYQNGNIKEDLFIKARNMKINALKKTGDFPPDFATAHLLSKIYETPFSIEDKIKEFESITIDEVVEAAKAIFISAIYFLSS